MLANAGVNINDSVQVRNHLNIYYNRNYSYAAYSQVLSGCANQTLNYVLALPGIEAEEAKEAYRYGFNAGSEKDDEIFIGAYTAEYWEYDSRLGRRWNVDPVVKPWESGYATLHNNPLFFIDPLGLDPVKRLSLGKRINNFFKGDSYKNRANKHIVDNKIDDSKVKYERGKITIDESYIKASKDEDGYINIMRVSKITEFVDENPVEGNKYDWAGNCSFKTAGLGFDYSSKASINYGVGANGTITNSSRIYGKSENDIQVANLTSISGGGGVSSNALKAGTGSEAYGYLFLTDNYSLVPTTSSPKLAVTTSTQILWIKVNYKVSMNLDATSETWELKIGFTNKSSLDLSRQVAIEKRLATFSTEKK